MEQVTCLQFRGNENNDETKFIKLRYVIKAQHVRVRPKSFYRHKCMRFELYGCSGNELDGDRSLGFEAGKVADQSLTASSILKKYHKPEFGRLNTFIKGGSWCARETNTTEYLQVDLQEIHKISNIILQGKYTGSAQGKGWVTKFSVTYSNDGTVWSRHKEGAVEVFLGNRPDNMTKNHEVVPSLYARFVRLHAMEWYQLICMRVEFIGCKACAKPLGMENRQLEQISGSSNKNRWHYIRLNNNLPWYPTTSDKRIFIQVVIRPYGKTVTALSIQGHSYWVISFTLGTSEDGSEWYDYNINGNIVVMPGCTTGYETSRQPLPKNITSRYVRLYPQTWQHTPQISVEFYGCDVCAEPLGMASGLIRDSNIKASSFKVGGEPWRARLGSGSGWIASSLASSEYIAVDLGEPKVITYIEMEGDSLKTHWLKFFFLDYRMTTQEPWTTYEPRGINGKITGVEMKNMVATIVTEQKLEARFIKIRVDQWHLGANLRLEFYGCNKVCSDEIGIGTWAIKDSALTASSYLSSRRYPWMARLDGREAWCPSRNDTQPFLQVDLAKPYRLRFIATQGLHSSNNSAWVQQYTLHFRKDLFPWIPYSENGTEKMFPGNTDGTSIVKNKLSNVSNVRYIRLHPKKWHIHACIRVELYGCKDFDEQSLKPLGMSDHRIPNISILASDIYLDAEMHGPWLARLHSTTGCWVFSKGDNFLQVDLGEGLVSVSGVATQGCNDNVIKKYGHVLEYKLSFSDDGSNWYYYREGGAPKIFSGNTPGERDLPVRHVFTRSFYTRYVKFLVTRWVLDTIIPALRVEIYGSRKGGELLAAANISISASSSRHPLTPQDCLLSIRRTWCAEFDDVMQYLQIDLKRNSYIGEIITQGAVVEESWVESYTISYGHSYDLWKQYEENGSIKVFQGNNDSSSIVTRKFMKQVRARLIRMHPISWNGHICMRFDLRTIGRSIPLGIQKHKIANSAMTASSHAGPANEPWRARLDVGFLSEAWRAGEDNHEQYLEIDLGTTHNITHVATQGSHRTDKSCWVTQFNLSHSLNGSVWKKYKENDSVKLFQGNTNDHGIVQQQMTEEIEARYIRFLPVMWFNHVCMRVELYGYQVCGFPLGVNDGELSNDSFTASSYGVGNEPRNARLNRLIGNGSWCAEKNLTGEYLQIALKDSKMITGISTQGIHHKDGKWVTEYALYYRDKEGSTFQPYTVDRFTKVFPGNTDQFSTVTHSLDNIKDVLYVRLEVKSWHQQICMRVELFGCDANVIEGGYSEWSAWSACSATCVGGFQYRERTCDNPKPENGGKDCSSLGADKEEVVCNTHICPVQCIVRNDTKIIESKQNEL
ncbi:uncharacterized protein LOC111326285 [Stylophora pistillata]|uniref:uncharacterized protein LOC111326285 n=1 Tax=Stylophora pistillata TaxID=50429 RepID=UPI000C038FD2|nr:uncharacterized protein LOC111326285 [Stylophora pistillata]